MVPIDIMTYVLQGGVPALALFILYLFARHHLKVIAEHREDEKHCAEKIRQLEQDFRTRIEDVYKAEIKLVEAVTSSLTDATNALEAVRKQLNKD